MWPENKEKSKGQTLQGYDPWQEDLGALATDYRASETDHGDCDGLWETEPVRDQCGLRGIESVKEQSRSSIVYLGTNKEPLWGLDIEQGAKTTFLKLLNKWPQLHKHLAFCVLILLTKCKDPLRI